METEYAEIVSVDTFEKIDIIEENKKALMLIAAKVNVEDSNSGNCHQVRLIDNIEL